MKQENKTHNGLFRIMIIVAAACLIHGVMQGVHDNYGIMMTGLLPVTGIDYAGISFCIGTGALVYGFAQPFLGMLALKKSNVFVILMGIAFTITGLIVTPLCRNFFSLFLFFWAGAALWHNRTLLWDCNGGDNACARRAPGGCCFWYCAGKCRDRRCSDVSGTGGNDF